MDHLNFGSGSLIKLRIKGEAPRMTFDDILNCLFETRNTIQRLTAELEDARTAYGNAQYTIEQLQKELDDAYKTIAKLTRQAVAQRVIGVALCFDMQDIRYKFGGEWENDKAFDCSAFLQVCFRVGTQGSVKLPRTSHEQSWVGTAVAFDQIEPGDTLHYDFDGDGKVTHVGLAMDNIWMIHTNNPENNINIIRIMDYNNGKGLVRVRRHIGV
jgi:cell wall-associated NlpC family hydrolase